MQDVDARARYDRRTRSLVGRRLLQVDYWDLGSDTNELGPWDHGDWHHAVMGLQLSTDAGPVTVTWTNVFHPYGVDVLAGPIETYLRIGEGGPVRNGPVWPSRWAAHVGEPILEATTWWDRVGFGPSHMISTGEIVSAAYEVDVPTALRLDFPAGPVWFVSAIPGEPPSPEEAFVMGDEIMVVFAERTMRSIGFADHRFVSSP